MATDQGEQEREVVVQPTSSATNPASPPLRSDDSTDEVNVSIDSQGADESDNSTDRSVSSGDETGGDIEESSYMEDDNQDDSLNKTSDSMHADANESSLILSVGRPERVMDPATYRSPVIIDSDESESGEEEDGTSEGSPQESSLIHPNTDDSYVEVVDSSCREEEEEEEMGCEEETGEEEEGEETGGEEEEEEERGGEEEEEEEERGGEEEEEEEETGGEEEEEEEEVACGEDEGEKGGDSPRSVETVYDQSLSSVETSTDNADLHLTKEGSCVSPDSGVSLQEGSEGLSKLSEKRSVSRHSLTDPSPQKEIEVLDTNSSDDGDSGSTCISPGADATHEPDMDETDYRVSSIPPRPGLSNQAKPSLADASSKGHRREGLDKPEPQFKVGYQYRTLVKQLEQMEVSREGGGGGRRRRMEVSREGGGGGREEEEDESE